MIKGAVIGIGQVSLNGHIPAWKESGKFKIEAGVDSSPAQLELFSKAMPGAKKLPSLDALEGLGLDFVDISTPPHTHFSIVKSALQKNLHVLCEKPLVLSEEELAELKKIAEERKKVLFTVHNWKFAAICRKASELIQNGTVGQVKNSSWYVLRKGPASTADAKSEKENWRLDPKRAGGGILVDHGWHALYVVLDWMPFKPAAVKAVLENRYPEELPVEDTVKVNIRFEEKNGIVPAAEIFLTWASRLRKNWAVIEGTEATLHLEDDHLRVVRKKEGAPEELYRFPLALSAGSAHPDWFGSVIDEFEGEISDEKRRGENLRIASTCLSLIHRSRESSAQGKEVPFR